MKQLLEFGNRYAKQSTWKDFALVKCCLFAMGLMTGLVIHQKSERLSKIAACVAFVVYWMTYLPLIRKVVDLLFAMRAEKKDAKASKR